MKRITEIDLTGLQKSVLWIVALSSILLKVIFDSFFLLLEQYDSFGALILRFILSLLAFLSLILLFFTGFNKNLSINEAGFDTYLSEILKILSISLILLIISFFLPKSIISGASPDNFMEIVFINYYSVSALILSLISIKFFLKWIWYRRYKFTKNHIRIIIAISILIIAFIDLPNHFSHLDPEEIKDNSFLLVLSIIFNISLIVVSFIASSKNHWIASLSITDKWKLLGSSFLLSLFSILFIINDLSHQGDGELINSLASVFPVVSVFGIAVLILLVYSTRIFFSVLFSMPTSSIIERKTGEFNSLSYLNRMISRAVDFDSLIDMVSNLSLTSGDGSVVWSDTLDSSGKFVVNKMQFSNNRASNNQVIKELEENFYLDSNNLIKTVSEPHYIESIPESHSREIRSLEKIFHSKSLIIIPLKASTDRIGTLYLLHTNEYGFDTDFLNLLNAFNDNITIAIENTRLLEESIEKEKYKKELKIAREMEQKLIPEVLPNDENYSLAGYSIPADEVGGDYYDIVTMKDGKQCLLIADVSGKGMSAAFYMVLLKGVVLSVSNHVSTVNELLIRINEILYSEMEKKMFITMSAVKIENESGEISIARAGHMPFILRRNNEVSELKPKGIGIGLASTEFFESVLESYDIKLEEGDSLLMYSDGIVEMFKDGKEINSGFLKQLVKNSVFNSSDGLLKEIKSTIEGFKKEYTVIDDMTLVCLTYNRTDNGETVNA